MAKITGVHCIRTREYGMWLIVKVLTDQAGLYGIGSASDDPHTATVQTAIETIGPTLIGREAGHIEDIWQSIFTSGYWRNGSILSTALAGIDMALWDIKGKEAGMPVYQLLGGPCRTAVPCYAHASGQDIGALKEDIQRYLDDGWDYIRCQLGPYGGGGFLDAESAHRPKHAWPARCVFDDEAYLESIPKVFDALRTEFGFGPKFTHDVHEHLRPHNAVTLAKLLEPYRLFFLEDALSPEDVAWYRLIRQQCTTPQAMGELFINPHEWMPLISERLIDFIRVRVSKVGGITRARKIAALCEWYGVHTAFQEGGDNDPVNQMAAAHLDMAIWNFGIQEEHTYTCSPGELDAFPGHAVTENGYLYVNDQPGLGIDIDEAKAAALLRGVSPPLVGEDRRADGTIVRP